jgi:brefeldin A-inhibited guanine nucleotide-exchange protein
VRSFRNIVMSAQIDRIMEKFAERFTKQTPEAFPTADAAFILAFSIITLNTDLHNPATKEDRRMIKEGFIRNDRGICDGKDLPEEMLNSIFDRLKRNPISLKEEASLIIFAFTIHQLRF